MEKQVLVEDEDSNLRGIQAAVVITEMGQQEHHNQAYRWRRVLQLISAGATPDEIRKLAGLALSATRLVQEGWPVTAVTDMLATCSLEDLCGEDGTLAIRALIVAHVYAANHYKERAYWATQAMNEVISGDVICGKNTKAIL